MDIFTLNKHVQLDNIITKKEYHNYQPYAGTNFKNNDEIRILIQAQDIYTFVADSYIHIEGKFTHTDPSSKLNNNAFLHLFDEIRYELNNVVIDKIRDPGIATTMKALASFSHADARFAEIAGWDIENETKLKHTNGSFSVFIPLKMVLGFAEMYRKVMINCKQELILHRTHTDDNCYHGKDGAITISAIEWHVPHINVNDEVKLQLLKGLRADKSIKIAFRQMELHELAELKQNTSEKWTIKTSNQLEKPRYIILAFQTGRKNVKEKTASEFDAAHIRNYKVFLNSESFPYDKQELDFDNNDFTPAYFAYSNFQSSYYTTMNDPLMTIATYKTCPIFVIDTSHQSETIKSGTVDIQLELEATSKKFPGSTCAYALIIHDVLFEYNPLTGIVNKLNTL